MPPPYPNPISWQWMGTTVTVTTDPLPGETPERTQQRHDEAVEFWQTECPPDD